MNQILKKKKENMMLMNNNKMMMMNKKVMFFYMFLYLYRFIKNKDFISGIPTLVEKEKYRIGDSRI